MPVNVNVIGKLALLLLGKVRTLEPISVAGYFLIGTYEQEVTLPLHIDTTKENPLVTNTLLTIECLTRYPTYEQAKQAIINNTFKQIVPEKSNDCEQETGHW